MLHGHDRFNGKTRFRDVCDRIAEEYTAETITREATEKDERTVSTERQEDIKTQRNTAFLHKLERGLAQVQAGQGIVKTMDELNAMAEERP